MSILISGMEMPVEQPVTLILDPSGRVWMPDVKSSKEYMAQELPPHGDLISRDDLLHTMRCHLALYDSCPEDLSLADKSRRDEIQNAIADIFNAPVVVPAERR